MSRCFVPTGLHRGVNVDLWTARTVLCVVN